MIYWQDFTFKELEEKIDEYTIVILPIGSVEEHGLHLPLNTDSIQPIYIAEEVAKRTGALILPPIFYGWTESMKEFKGTISIKFETLKNLVFDILEEVIKDGVKNIMVLSGHANRLHMSSIGLAAEELLNLYDAKIMVLSDYDIAYKVRGSVAPETDSHAGIIETSRILAISPEKVRSNMRFEQRKKEPEYMVLKNMREYYPYGTLSDPSKANVELGIEINRMIIEDLINYIKTNFLKK